ncbi:reverse transcriptase domain-containing protein [Tanacetum coccineum]
MMFPLSLTGEAKTWLDELNERTIETWDELRTTFIRRFFPLALFDRLLGEIRAFSQHENKSLTDACLRMKEMLRNCHGHNLSKKKAIIIKIFYHGLSEITQEVLNAAAGGIFLYKTPNQAYQLLEDKGNPEILLQDHAVVDSGCSSYMTGNKAYLSDYKDYNEGFLAFRSDPKGGKITGKGKIRTANLDFDDVYFVDELKFNLFSIKGGSQSG